MEHPGGTTSRPSREEITRTTRDLLAAELKIPGDTIEASTRLRELPGLDSIRILHVVARLEARYDVEVADEVIFGVLTLAELARAVEEQVEHGVER